MKLKLTNFKIFQNKTFVFPDEGVILLEGENGTGKSTVFSAIVFALYGSSRNIVSWEKTPNKKGCLVTLQFKELVIKRGKEPSVFKVIYKNQEFGKDTGQEIIDKVMGMDKDVFMKISYIQQKKASKLFLSLAPSEKLKLIQTLALKDEDKTYKEPIKQNIKQLKDQTIKEETYIETRREIIQEPDYLEKFEDEEISLILKNENDESISESIEKIKIEIELIDKNIKDRREELAEKFSFIEKVKEKKERYEKYIKKREFDIKKLEQLKSLLIEYNRQSISDKQEKKIQDEIEKLNIERADLKQKESLLTNYKKHMLLYSKHKEEVREKIKNLKHILSTTEDHRDYESLNNLYQEIIMNEENKKKKSEAKNNILQIFREIKQEDASLSEIKSATKMLKCLSEMRDNMKIFKCPNCEEHISINSEDKVSISKTKKITKTKLSRKKINNLYERLKVENENWTLPIKEYDENLESIKKQIQKISCAKDELEKLQSSSVNEKFEKTKELLEKQIESFEKDYDFSNKILEIEKTINKLKEDLYGIKKVKENIKETKKKIESKENELTKTKENDIEDDLDSIETYKKDISIISQEISNITTRLVEKKDELEKLEMMKGISKYKTDIGHLKEKEEKLEQTKTLLKGYMNLKDLDKQAEVLAIRKKIQSVNEISNIYLKSFFQDKPISIQIHESEKRPDQLGVRISFRGHVLDTLDILSGGEMQRCDLAFLFGINDMKNGKLILLDECFSFISGPGHEDIIQNLKEICQNRLVILVSHRAIEGSFNNIISLD